MTRTRKRVRPESRSFEDMLVESARQAVAIKRGEMAPARITTAPSHRPSTHPGEMLLEEFLKPLEMTQAALAEAIGVPVDHVNELIEGKRGITPDTASRLGRYFKTSDQIWLNLQQTWDLAQVDFVAPK